MIDGKGITGTMLLELTLSYVTAFNEGSFPEIKSSLERVIEREVSGISKSKAKKYMAVLGVNLKKVQEGDIEGYYKIYKTVMNMLEKDLKALAEARRDISLFWQIKEKVVKKMDEKFKDYLEYKQGAADKYNEELVKKLKENIGVPRTLPITKYFEESRLKKFHKGMIDWLSGSLNSDKTMTLEIVKLLCSYYERYAMEGHSIAKIEMSKIQDDLDLEKNNQETYKEMIKQQNKYAGEMDSEFDKMRSMLKRKDREIEALNSTTSSSKDTMMVRLRALEGQCADYKEENSLLQKKLMRLKSDGGLHNPNLVKGDYKDLENYLEKNGKDLTKEQFSSEFERYKKTVHNAISSANKKVNIENTRLKSEFVDYKKKLKEVLEQKEKLEEQLKDKQDYIEDTCQQKKLDEFWRLEVECKRMKADKDAFFWVLAESLKKAKKKKTANLENALKLLCEEDQKEVMNIFKSVGLKVKLK